MDVTMDVKCFCYKSGSLLDRLKLEISKLHAQFMWFEMDVLIMYGIPTCLKKLFQIHFWRVMCSMNENLNKCQ